LTVANMPASESALLIMRRTTGKETARIVAGAVTGIVMTAMLFAFARPVAAA